MRHRHATRTLAQHPSRHSKWMAFRYSIDPFGGLACHALQMRKRADWLFRRSLPNSLKSAGGGRTGPPMSRRGSCPRPVIIAIYSSDLNGQVYV
jgi:hypothetical protein